MGSINMPGIEIQGRTHYSPAKLIASILPWELC